jgi:hypothetical protein
MVRQRSIRKVYDEFATRTCLYREEARGLGRRFVGDPEMAVRDSTERGRRIDHGNGGRAVLGYLGS